MKCEICPRRCGADRSQKPGVCGVGDVPRVARATLHRWEEPCISGTRGSGTVFFSGCALKCRFCQNHEISAGAAGEDISIERLADIYLELQAQGAHNVNLVSPSHFPEQIAESLRLAKANGLSIPVVWNSGGYDSLEGLALVRGLVDIYMPDLKYVDPARSARYSAAPDYFAVASEALKEMFRQVGPAVFDADGMMQKGLIIRHLVLPGGTGDSVAALNWIADTFGIDDVVVSLMSQYMPCHQSAACPEINRKLTTLEYGRVLRRFEELGFARGYCQKRESAEAGYVPAFNLEGVARKPDGRD